MVELALTYHDRRFLTARDIAKSEGVPIKFLEQILLTLKHAGFVDSKMGARGGYALKKPPGEITFGAVIRTFEGAIAPIGCVDLNNPKFCSELWHCRFHRVMSMLRDAISNIVDKTTLADVCGQDFLPQGQGVKDQKII
jgi:Rrf2 family protein